MLKNDFGAKDFTEISWVKAEYIASFNTHIFLKSNNDETVLHLLLGNLVKLNKIWHDSSNCINDNLSEWFIICPVKVIRRSSFNAEPILRTLKSFPDEIYG